MVINMPHTPAELAESFAKRDVEIDARDMTEDEADILASFLAENGFHVRPFHDAEIIDMILDWRSRYGILVSDTGRAIGANEPFVPQFGIVRLTMEEVMEILPKPTRNISEEDFDSVF